MYIYPELESNATLVYKPSLKMEAKDYTCKILPVGRAGSKVVFSQEFTCSQVNPLVPRDTLYPQLLYDSSNVQPPNRKKE